MRARAEHVDSVTGAATLKPVPGSEPSGRLLARVRPRDGARLVVVEVDPEEVIRGDVSYAVDPSMVPHVRDRAKTVASSRAKKKRRGRSATGLAARTYRSAGAGALEFYQANAQFFDAAAEADPLDYVEDWLRHIDVRRGKSWKRLADTKLGQELADGFRGGKRGGAAVVAVLRWIFSQNRSRRWSAVPWDMVRSFEDALREAYDGAGAVWYPVASGELTPAAYIELEEQSPDVARARADVANVDRLADDLGALRRAYNGAKQCLDPQARKLVARRIRQLARMLKDGNISNATLCQPEGMTRLCAYPAVEAEISRLRAACERASPPEVDLPWENPKNPVEVGWKAPVPTTAKERAMKAPKTMKVRPRKLDRKAPAKAKKKSARLANPGKPLKRGPIPLRDMNVTDLDGTKIIEARTGTHTYQWPAGRPLLWDPSRKAFVWFQGVGEKRIGSTPTRGGPTKRIHDAWSWRGRTATKDVEFVVPALSGQWHSMGRLRALAYRSPKDGRAADYEHAVESQAKLYRFGGPRPPWVWVATGGRLNVTKRGIIG